MEKFGIPVSLGRALTENPQALYVFSHLDRAEKRQVIANAHLVKSEEEMEKYIAKLASRNQGSV